MKGAKIGSGVFGTVFSGISSVTGNFFAIKEVSLGADNEVTRKKKKDLIETIEFLRSLDHPNLIKYYTVEESTAKADCLAIISEVCNGESLSNLIRKFGVLEERLIRQYIYQVLEGVDYLHSQGIIHGNLKISNILIEGDGNVKVSDYLYPAIFYGSTSNEIIESFVNFKEASNNIAPEVVKHCKKVTPAIDIWAVGCLIISMSTGKSVWENLVKDKKELLDLIASTEGCYLTSSAKISQ